MSTEKHTPEFVVEYNAKIGKHQIKLGNFNVAVAEFYENTTSAREEIEAIFSQENPTELLAEVREAMEAIERNSIHTTFTCANVQYDPECPVCRARAVLAKLPKAKGAQS